MDQWEYLAHWHIEDCVRIEHEEGGLMVWECINKLGEEGWEAYHYREQTYRFKRKKIS